MAKTSAKNDLFAEFEDDLNEETENFGTWPAWKTGIPFIDLASGIGGLPKGRIVECFGPESSGKSTVFLKTIAQTQKDHPDKISVILDYEDSYDPKWGEHMGIKHDNKTFRVIKPESLEDGFTWIYKAVQDPRVAIIVIDSVATMPTNEELAGGLDKVQMASQAKVLKKALKLFLAETKKCHSTATLCLINQMYDIVGGFNPTGNVRTTTSGGRATKYAPSMRIEFKKVGQETENVYDAWSNKKEKKKVADKIKATFVKNKVAAPFKDALFVCREGVGIDLVWSTVALAKLHKIIEGTTWIEIPGEYTHTGETVKLNGEAAVRAYYHEHDDAYEALEAKVIEYIKVTQNVDLETGEVPMDLDGGDTDLEDLEL